MAKSMKLGGGGRFQKLKGQLSKKGATNPGALAAFIGRKKYGAKKFASLSKKRGDKITDMKRKRASKGGMKPTKAAGAPKSAKKPFGKLSTDKNANAGGTFRQLMLHNSGRPQGYANKFDTGMTLLGKAMKRMAREKKR